MNTYTKFSKRKKLLPQCFHAILVIALLIVAGALVYQAGGTKFVYTHLMYIPILLSAYYFHIPGGVIAGLLAGLILGPSMPLDVMTGEMQSLEDWLLRMTIFSAMGLLSGGMLFHLKQQFKKAEWIFYHDEDTGLPNREQLLQSIKTLSLEENSIYALMVFSLNNYSEIASILDDDELNELSTQIIERTRVFEANTDFVSLIYPYILVSLQKIERSREEALNFVNKIHEVL